MVAKMFNLTIEKRGKKGEKQSEISGHLECLEHFIKPEKTGFKF